MKKSILAKSLLSRMTIKHKKLSKQSSMSKKLPQTLLSILMIGIILFNISSVLWSQKDKYLAHNYWENYKTLKQSYLDSQYVNKHATAWIPDEMVFSYAGGALIKGVSPVLVVVDAPPLGKYLIGLSAILFDNEKIIVAIFGILSLVMLYVLSDQILKNKIIALIPVVIYSSEPMFKNQFIYTPLLDLFQLFFILCYFYFTNKAFLDKKRTISFFILSSIFLGCFISTKFFISGTTLITAAFIWASLQRNIKKILGVVFTFPIAIIILLLNYLRVFAFGYSFHRFLGIQKYIFLYHRSQIIFPFSVWPLLFLNRWYGFGNLPYATDSQWSISWPIITSIAFVTILFYLLKKLPRRPEIEVLMLWSLLYLCFLSFGQIFSRYFIILLPILYIISTYGLLAGITSLRKYRKKKPNKSGISA